MNDEKKLFLIAFLFKHKRLRRNKIKNKTKKHSKIRIDQQNIFCRRKNSNENKNKFIFKEKQ